MDAMRPGASWVEMHHLAHLAILEALLSSGLLVGDVSEMISSRKSNDKPNLACTFIH